MGSPTSEKKEKKRRAWLVTCFELSTVMEFEQRRMHPKKRNHAVWMGQEPANGKKEPDSTAVRSARYRKKRKEDEPRRKREAEERKAENIEQQKQIQEQLAKNRVDGQQAAKTNADLRSLLDQQVQQVSKKLSLNLQYPSMTRICFCSRLQAHCFERTVQGTAD